MLRRSSPAVIESVEARRLLSVSAAVTGGALAITGNGAANQVFVRSTHLADGTSTLRSGNTSVFLDLPLLQSAANLTLSGVNSTGQPFSPAFQVGFPITPATTFKYDQGDLAPFSGEIRHTGTVSFNNNAITVGNFTIGFDASRVGGQRSGFFVRDTVAGLGILFDISNPTAVNAGARNLSISGANLLVSAEFAGALQTLGLASSNLSGADVGNARIDGHARANFVDAVGVRSPGLAGGVERKFAVASISGITVDLAGGNDLLRIDDLGFSKPVTVSLGSGNDRLDVDDARLGSLTARAGDGNDALSLRDSRFSTVSLSAGAGNDVVLVSRVRAAGSFSAAGEAGRDVLTIVDSALSNRVLSGFETRTIVA